MTTTALAEALEKIEPYVFRVLTPTGGGSGFQLSYSPQTDLCGVATALHVVSHAFEWEDPIKLLHDPSDKEIVLREGDRFIDTLPSRDLAFIIFKKEELPLKADILDLIEEGTVLKQGIQTGWCGFPAVARNDLCFFTGYVSSYLDVENSYLIDGVTINGVSGGPSFYLTDSNQVVLCGIVSAYIPNRVTGEALPGVSVIRDISPYRDRLKRFESLEKAHEDAQSVEQYLEPPDAPVDKKTNLH